MEDPATRRAITRRGLAAIAGAALCALFCGIAVEALGLGQVRGIVWPTDLLTFDQIAWGPIDVAVVGSSRASFALSPDAVDDCLEGYLDRPTQTVNLARTYATAWTARGLVEELLDGERAPRVLLLAVGPEFFDEHNHQRALDAASHARLPRPHEPKLGWEAETPDRLVRPGTARAPGPWTFGFMWARKELMRGRAGASVVQYP